MAEVWLLETYYGDGSDYEEIYLHIPGTDIWVTDEGASSECLNVVDFTNLFWERQGDEHLFTKLGEL